MPWLAQFGSQNWGVCRPGDASDDSPAHSSVRHGNGGWIVCINHTVGKFVTWALIKAKLGPLIPTDDQGRRNIKSTFVLEKTIISRNSWKKPIPITLTYSPRVVLSRWCMMPLAYNSLCRRMWYLPATSGWGIET